MLFVTLLPRRAGFCSGPRPAGRNLSLLDERTPTSTASALDRETGYSDVRGNDVRGSPSPPNGTWPTAPAYSETLSVFTDVSHFSPVTHLIPQSDSAAASHGRLPEWRLQNSTDHWMEIWGQLPHHYLKF